MPMHTDIAARAAVLAIEQIDSDADFVLLSAWGEVLSEHCTAGEAQMAMFEEVSRQQLGGHLPAIYRRREPFWVLQH